MLDSINDVISKDGNEEFDGDLKSFAGESKGKKFKKGRNSEKASDIKIEKTQDKTEKVSNFFARKNNMNSNSIYNKNLNSEISNHTINENLSQESNTNSSNTNSLENICSADIKDPNLKHEKNILDEQTGKLNEENSDINENLSGPQDHSNSIQNFEENVNSTNSTNQQNEKKSKDSKNKDDVTKILDDAPFMLNDIPSGNKNKKYSKKKDKKKSKSHHGDSSLDNLFGNGGIIVITQSFHHNDNDSVRFYLNNL